MITRNNSIDPLAARELELHMPDEDRVFVIHGAQRCERCGYNSVLKRRASPLGTLYQVACGLATCGNHTPEFKSSAEAVTNWNMVAVLSK